VLVCASGRWLVDKMDLRRVLQHRATAQQVLQQLQQFADSTTLVHAVKEAVHTQAPAAGNNPTPAEAADMLGIATRLRDRMDARLEQQDCAALLTRQGAMAC
jgi:hypothetical protein